MKLQLILTIFLAACTVNSFACSMGFSFHFEPLTSESPYSIVSSNDIEEYLNEKYGENKWESGNDLFALDVPKIPENSAVIPVTFGAPNKELSGLYPKIELYVAEYINVIDNEKFNKEYLPAYYHVDDLSKNSNKAFNFKEITHKEKRINNVANFKLSNSSLPYISTRLNLSHATRSQVFAVFVPKSKADKPKVIIQVKDFHTGHPCKGVYYVRGKWPEGLRREHKYE